MYSRPVADSIDRERAVWTDAQQTTNGKISPTIRRSHTKRAHGPTSDENGATSAGPAPVAVQATNSTTWATTTASSTRASRIRGASGSLGVTRYQWPRISAAKTPPMAALTTASWTSRETAPKEPPPQASAPNTRVAVAAARPAQSRAEAIRGPRLRATSQSATTAMKTTRAARRGASQAGSTTTGDVPSESGRAPSEI